MPISERRTVLLATHVTIRPERQRDREPPDEPPDDRPPRNDREPPEDDQRPPPKNPDAAKDHALRRLRTLAVLFENRKKAAAIVARLRKMNDAGAALALRLADLALADKWDELRTVVSQMTWQNFDAAVQAWLEAEAATAKEVGDAIREVAMERQKAPRDTASLAGALAPDGSRIEFRDEPVEIAREVRDRGFLRTPQRFERGSAAVAGQRRPLPDAVAPVATPSLPQLLRRLQPERAQEAEAFLWGVAQPYDVDAERVQAQVQSKKMIVSALMASSTVEPVGYLHLEKLFFEPIAVELGELVQSIPLMPGETRRFTHSEWANTRSEYEKLVTESLEKAAEESLAETSELTESTNAESSRDLAFSLAASVSGSYGTVSFGVNTGLNINQSENQSRTTSARRSREITEKASSRSKQERKVEFTFTSEAGTSDTTFQEITNQDDEEITWAYYRVMTKWEVTLARYDVRLTYDLVVPDPANRLLRMYQRLHDLRTRLTTQEAFTLTVSSITRSSFLSLSAQYGAALEPPPPDYIAVVGAATHSQPGEKTTEAHTLALSAPEGYAFDGGWSATWWANAYSNDTWPSLDPWNSNNSGKIGGVRGTFPWTYTIDWGRGSQGGAAGIQVRAGAQLTTEAYQLWKTQMWERAYDAWLSQRERQQAAWRRELDELEAQLGSPDALTLRKREHEEIMRVTLAWLIGPQFDFYPDVLPQPSNTLGPDIGLYTGEGQVKSDFIHEQFLRHGELVRFLHQAIEWENLIYLVYPYFWTHESRWEPKDGVRHPDFVHQTFLRGGAARVVLTIRPGFEEDFLAYVTSASLNVPLPGNHPYVTVAEELRNMAQTSYPYTKAADPPNPANIVETWHEFTPTGALFVEELEP